MTPLSEAFDSSPAARPAPAPDFDCGCWKLLELGGAGAMADIYWATPQGGEAAASYAVKVLKSQWETDPAAVGVAYASGAGA